MPEKCKRYTAARHDDYLLKLDQVARYGQSSDLSSRFSNGW